MNINSIIDAIKQLEQASTTQHDDMQGASDAPDVHGKPVAMSVEMTSAKPLDGGGDDDDLGMMDDLHDDRMHGDDSSEDDPMQAARDTSIVQVLQDQFPEIYAQVCKVVDGADHGMSDAEPARF